ncbi:nucleobase:cation symporter-2 family protein [Pararhodobacter sp.]|uniref:nucleobase:cation symporter-2 family protein n=1 Tax=Pararhodobacter sp. TaxID=2127056 RepID=UPI002AFE21DB|nr:nucleobase:cation symporter-2 family protein [Pararhodobacter sp.]
MTTEQTVHPADQVPPGPQLFALGLQHVLVMYAGAIAVPLIIGGAIGLPKEEIAFLISADLFVTGIVSIIQSMGFWRFGARIPVMMGVTFASVPPMILFANDPNLGLPGIYGAVIGAGIVVLLIAPFISRMIRFFPPVVTGTVISVTGLALMPIGINWAAGGQPMVTRVVDGVRSRVPNPEYGSLEFLGLSILVLLIILAVTRFGRGFVSNIAVLIGLAGGFAITLFLGRVEFEGVAEASWFAVITPFHFGFPIFNIGAIFSMSIVMVIVMVETAGMLLAVGEMVDRPMDEKRMADGLRVDGLGSIIGGIFNTFPYVSYSQNVGLVGVTGVKSRWVCVMAGAIMIMLGLVPKLAVIAASIPIYVLGGAGIVMFGMVCATGIRILSKVDYAERGNLFIVGVSVVLGMIPVLSPTFYSHAPAFLAPITHSGIVMSAISAFMLNLYFSHLGGRKPGLPKTLNPLAETVAAGE